MRVDQCGLWGSLYKGPNKPNTSSICLTFSGVRDLAPAFLSEFWCFWAAGLVPKPAPRLALRFPRSDHFLDAYLSSYCSFWRLNVKGFGKLRNPFLMIWESFSGIWRPGNDSREGCASSQLDHSFQIPSGEAALAADLITNQSFPLLSNPFLHPAVL